MNDINYDYIWRKLVVPTIDSYIEDIPKHIIEAYSVKVRDLKTMKKKINIDYHQERDALKKNFHNGLNGSGRIDEHKIAACICKSLVDNKPIDYKLDSDLPNVLLFANYTVAFNTSIGIIFIHLLNIYNATDDKVAINKMLANRGLFFPDTTETHDSYEKGIIKMITLNDLYGKGFDLLAYSNIMYSLEEFNKQIE